MAARPFRPTLFLLIFASVSAFAATLSAAVPVEPSAPGSPPPYGDQFAARGASYDGGAFLVWDDYRAGAVWPDVYGARVQFNGQVLDPTGIPIATGPLAQEFADVACVSGTCLVAWRNEGFVEAARFLEDGTRLDAAPIAVGGGANVHAIAAAAGLDEFLVAWAQGTDIVVQLIATDGTLKGSPATLPRGNDVRTPMNAASDGSGYMLTWSEALPPSQDQTRSVVFRPPATFMNGPQILTTSSYPTFPDVAAAGRDGGFVSIWHTYPTGQFTGQVLSKRFISDGNQFGGTITTNINGNVDFGFPSVSYDGTAWQIVYRSGPGNLTVTTMNVASGVRTNPIDLSSGNESALPVIVASGNQTLLAWSEGFGYRPSNLRHGVVQSGALVVDGGSLTVRGGVNQTGVTGAFGGGFLWVVWEDDRGGSRQLRMRKFDEQGNPATPASALAISPDEMSQPSIVFDGEAFVVAWIESGASGARVQSLRFGLDGTVLPPGAQTLADPVQFPSKPSLAVGPQETFALWSSYSISQSDDVYLRRIGKDGGLDAQASGLIVAPGYQSNPSAGWSNGALCTAFQGRQPEDVEFACFDSALTPLDAGVLLDNQNYPSAPSLLVSPSGQNFVFWSALASSEGIEGKRVAQDGTTVASFEVSAPADNALDTRARQSLPAVASDGQLLSAAYEIVTADGGTDIQLKRFDSAGTVVDTIAVANSVEEERFPTLVPLTPGRMAVLYSKFDRAAGGMRAELALVTDVAEGQHCLAPTECRVGTCVASICCTGALCDVLADGGIVLPDGGVTLADGGVIADDGGTESGNDGGTNGNSVRARLGVQCGCSMGNLPFTLALLALIGTIAAVRRRRSGSRPRS